MCRGVYTMGWAICRIVTTGDVLGMGSAIGFLKGRVDAFECVIGWSVAAMPVPPSFNHTSVVCENLEMKIGGSI